MRRFPQSALNAFGRWVSAHSWFEHAHPCDSSLHDYLISSFSGDLSNAINIYFPTKSVRLHPTDKPRMSAEIKSLILERQRAYHSGPTEKWRHLRNKVREVICKRKKAFYPRKVQNVKGTDPRNWWGLENNCAIQTRTATLYLVRPSPLVQTTFSY